MKYTIDQIKEQIEFWNSQKADVQELLDESKKNDEPEKNRKVQNIFNHLITSEWLAGTTYNMMILGCKQEQLPAIESALSDTAEDEIEDHLKNLVKCARSNGYKIPSTFDDYMKYGNKEDIDLFKTFKKGKDAIYYVDQIIEAERRAIAEYSEFIESGDATEIPELASILQNNYYDECEHLDTFKFIKYSIESNMTDF